MNCPAWARSGAEHSRLPRRRCFQTAWARDREPQWSPLPTPWYLHPMQKRTGCSTDWHSTAPEVDPPQRLWRGLSHRLTAGHLPGIRAQMELAPPGRVDPDYEAVPEGARLGAVLMLLCPTPTLDDLWLPLIQRAEDSSTHSGQIALPGGGFEDGDEFPVGTAVREACEEIGLREDVVHVAGTLTPLFIPVSNFSIVPVVGVYGSTAPLLPTLVPQPSEVARIIGAEVKQLTSTRDTRTVPTSRGPWDVPTFLTGRQIVWGATAMMLNELFAILGQTDMLSV